ncbi:cell division protein SepF [Enterococcus nangangensis]
MAFFNRQKIANFFGLADDDDYDYTEEVVPATNPVEKRVPEYRKSTTANHFTENNGQESEPQQRPREERYQENRSYGNKEKVVPLNNGQRSGTANRSAAQITIVEPRVYSEALNIAKKIVANEAVIVNFRLIEEPQARRIVDFLTGTVYALGGDIQRIGSEIFLCTPVNITIDGATAKSMLVDEFSDLRS